VAVEFAVRAGVASERSQCSFLFLVRLKQDTTYAPSRA
jgi:hypothetical protein